MMDDAPSPLRSTAEWLSEVKAFEREGEFFKAYDHAVQGLNAHPDDLWLKHRAVLSLARAGATSLAQRKFAELGLDAAAEAHEDIDALAARLMKDEALSSVGDTRRHKAAAAAERYAAIHARYRDYYPAINAATLRLVAGNEAGAEEYAHIALAALNGAEDYYACATRIEALFLLGEIEEARALFPAALRANGGDHAAVATTWRQLCLILELKGLDARIFAAEFAPPRMIHFLGHIISENGRFKPAEETAVQEKIAAHFATARIGFGYGSLAAGADILFAEELLRSGASLHVVLPFERDEFVDISVRPAGAAWVQRFDRCLAAAATVRYTTEDRYLGDDHLFAYGSRLAMGLALLHARHLGSEIEQVAVWDGGASGGAGGTADDIETWRRLARPQTIIACGNGQGSGVTTAKHASSRSAGGRVIRAMLFCDIKGFSKLTDVELPKFVNVLLGAVGAVVDCYGGAVSFANTWGDGLFLVFEDPAQAARCALDLQAALGAIDLAATGLPATMAMRIGGHLGPAYAAPDPVLKRVNYFGAHVSLAARIEPVTPEGCVYVTETFAAFLGLEHGDEFACDYVGMTEGAKKYGAMRMFLLRRAAG